MSSDSSRTTIFVAAIGAVGVIVAAAISNLDKIQGNGRESSNQASGVTIRSIGDSSPNINAPNGEVRLNIDNSTNIKQEKSGLPEIPISSEMKYDVARSILVSNGWQPYEPPGPRQLACGELDMCRFDGPDDSANWFFDREIDLRRTFRSKGWHEAIQCLGTGTAECIHAFSDTAGRILYVHTGSGAYDEMPNVFKFYLRKK